MDKQIDIQIDYVCYILGGESTMMNILMNKTNMLNSIREWQGKVVS